MQDHRLPAHHRCAGCSPRKGAPETQYWANGPYGVRGRVRMAQRHEGWAGVAHGGAVGLILDEAVGYILSHLDRRAVTGRLEIEYVAPVPTRVWIDIVATMTSHEGRRTGIDIGVRRGDKLLTRASAIGVEIALDRAAFRDQP